jgi:glycosyltransferase involved in cell wall biosynthesis
MNSATVIIPTLNEAATIHRTVATTKSRLPNARVLIVDGGSTDGTAANAAAAGAEVVYSGRGRGL